MGGHRGTQGNHKEGYRIRGLPLRDNTPLRVAVDILDASDGKLKDPGDVVLHNQ